MPRVPTFLTSWVPGPPADNLARDRFAGTPSSAPSSVLIILERCFICRLNENILPPRKPRRKTLPRQNAQVEWLRRIWTAKKSLRSEQLKFLKEITKTHVQSIMVPRVRARFGCWFRLPAYWVQGEKPSRGLRMASIDPKTPQVTSRCVSEERFIWTPTAINVRQDDDGGGQFGFVDEKESALSGQTAQNGK